MSECGARSIELGVEGAFLVLDREFNVLLTLSYCGYGRLGRLVICSGINLSRVVLKEILLFMLLLLVDKD